ncbi:MAG: catalase [Janthinobacterium lividum]
MAPLVETLRCGWIIRQGNNMNDDSGESGFSRRETFALGTVAAGAVFASRASAAAPSTDSANVTITPPHRIVDAKGGIQVASSGDLHQVRTGATPAMTTQQGVAIADDQNSLKVGPRGPVLLNDFILREKINRFDHERIPERVVHARGTAAHGYFELTNSLGGMSKADVFQRVGERVPVFTRFSTVAGNKGSADLARDVRGFAVKFYTKEGNWDLVGNNIPVFFIQDAIKFPDLVHAVKEEPDRGFPQAQSAHDTFWDWTSLTPESMHMIMWIMSDRAIPRSFRMMEGFGVHSFRLVDAGGKSTYVKFHWRPMLGSQSVVWDEAVKINGADPDFHRRDLWNAINEGHFPEWELSVQTFDEAFAKRFDFDVLDSTKLIPEEVIPLRPIGRMVLNRNPDNHFAEVEQVAFCTQNIVPGIDFTNDPLLAGRNFSYLDTQMTRLGGPNFAQIPINQPRVPVKNYQRDGFHQMQVPKGRVAYEPNSLSVDGPREDPVNGYRSFAAHEAGDTLRVRSDTFADHFSQARMFFMSQTEPEQNHIVAALTFELSKVETKAIRDRMLGQLVNIDPSLGRRVASGLGHRGPIERIAQAVATRTNLRPSPALSILAKAKPTLQGRKVGCLVADGTDASMVEALRQATVAAGADFKVIAPKIEGAVGAGGTIIPADMQLAGGPSVLFDAVVVVAAPAGGADLATEAAAVAWVHDAFQHVKVIGFTAGAVPLLDKAGVTTAGQPADAGVIALADGGSGSSFLGAASRGRVWSREPVVKKTY